MKFKSHSQRKAVMAKLGQSNLSNNMRSNFVIFKDGNKIKPFRLARGFIKRPHEEITDVKDIFFKTNQAATLAGRKWHKVIKVKILKNGKRPTQQEIQSRQLASIRKGTRKTLKLIR